MLQFAVTESENSEFLKFIYITAHCNSPKNGDASRMSELHIAIFIQ